MPRGDGPFKVLQRINNNAYKLEHPSEYGNVSATSNVSDLSLFDVGDEDDGADLRTNPFEERGNDMNPSSKPKEIQGKTQIWRKTYRVLEGNEANHKKEVCSKPLLQRASSKVTNSNSRIHECGGVS